jgi:hypothetical protein
MGEFHRGVVGALNHGDILGGYDGLRSCGIISDSMEVSWELSYECSRPLTLSQQRIHTL